MDALRVYDPRQIFDTADQFLISGENLFKSFDKKGAQFVTVTMTCLAFSLELYFKSLITIEKGGFPDKAGHNVKSLLEMLDDDTQQKIKEYVTEDGVGKVKKYQEAAKLRGTSPPEDFDFDNSVEASNRAFVNWR
jgi:hypothetical protein